MESKWPLKSLEELGVQLLDCVHQTPKEQDTGMPYIGIPQMKNGEIDFKASPRIISQEDFLKWTEKVNPSHGDIILSRRCNPGETAFVPQNAQFALGQNLVLLRPDPKKLHPGYLRWVVQSPFWWDEVERYRNPGAVFDSLKCADIPKFLVPEPPREIQESLDRVLLAIAEKITLNRQINQTLEQMAQTLFKSWFVDFDPVIDNALDAGNDIPDTLQDRAEQRRLLRAKADFKPLPTETRALFPSEFEETELGWVPKGWAVVSFGDVSNCFDSKRIPLSKQERELKQPGSIPYYGATSEMDLINEWIFDDIYLLMGEDGSVMKDDGTPFLQYIWGKSWVNNHAHVLQGKEDISTEHLLVFLQQCDIKAFVTGAVQLKINQKNMNSIPFVKAIESINLAFQKVICPLFDRRRQIEDESRTLRKLRDSLLPKLISGELVLDDLPEEIAEAAEAV